MLFNTNVVQWTKKYTTKKRDDLQLALQLCFWVAMTTCNSLYLYLMSVFGQITWVTKVTTHHIYDAILSQQFPFNYYATLLWLQP
jgi:hypothetical protein